MYQIIFYVPQENKEAVKEAMFAAGAGRLGNYSHCAWEVLGSGQFLPHAGSQPHIGQQNVLEKVPEYRVEMICARPLLEKVVQAMLASHPYEEPAYAVLKILSLAEIDKLKTDE